MLNWEVCSLYDEWMRIFSANQNSLVYNSPFNCISEIVIFPSIQDMLK